MAEENLCPTCHSLIAADAINDRQVQGETEPGDEVDIVDSSGNEVKARVSTSKAVPQWTNDPLLTTDAFNGEDFRGEDINKLIWLVELQNARIAEEEEIGLSKEFKTAFSLLTVNETVPLERHIVELRESTEKILNVIGVELKDYFKTDINENEVDEGPNDIEDKEEWSDIERGKPYVTNDGTLKSTFTLPDGTEAPAPSVPDETKLRVVLLEDLRHPLHLLWKEFWSVTAIETLLNNSEIALEDKITINPTDGGLPIEIGQDGEGEPIFEKSWFIDTFIDDIDNDTLIMAIKEDDLPENDKTDNSKLLAMDLEANYLISEEDPGFEISYFDPSTAPVSISLSRALNIWQRGEVLDNVSSIVLEEDQEGLRDIKITNDRRFKFIVGMTSEVTATDFEEIEEGTVDIEFDVGDLKGANSLRDEFLEKLSVFDALLAVIEQVNLQNLKDSLTEEQKEDLVFRSSRFISTIGLDSLKVIADFSLSLTFNMKDTSPSSPSSSIILRFVGASSSDSGDFREQIPIGDGLILTVASTTINVYLGSSNVNSKTVFDINENLNDIFIAASGHPDASGALVDYVPHTEEEVGTETIFERIFLIGNTRASRAGLRGTAEAISGELDENGNFVTGPTFPKSTVRTALFAASAVKSKALVEIGRMRITNKLKEDF